MFNVVVEWLDQDKSRARFSLPVRNARGTNPIASQK